MRKDDILVKQQIEFKDPGRDGTDVVWEFSKLKFINDKYQWVPENTQKFILGCDPFMYNKTNNNRKSNGGGAVFMRRDKRIDNDTRPIEQWETYRFVCTYSNRTFDKNTYLEDMAMCAQYYGCCAYPENNVSAIEDYFMEHGYSQYLAYSIVLF